MPGRFAAATALRTFLVTPAEADGPGGDGDIGTIFGHVRVDPGNVQAATDEGEAAYSAARTLLGLRKPRFAVMDMARTGYKFGDRLPDGTPVYVWQFNKIADERWPPPTYILRHEIGHDLFIRYLVPDTKGDQYGGDAPDRLDEMAAVAFEGDALRASRRRDLLGSGTRVRDPVGATPFSYQPAYLDPIGRTISFGLRKVF
jgi:hypothetical protein